MPQRPGWHVHDKDSPTEPCARLVNSESRIYGIQRHVQDEDFTGVRIQMRSNMVNVSPTKYGKETPPTSNTREAYIIGSFRRAEHTNEPDMAGGHVQDEELGTWCLNADTSNVFPLPNMARKHHPNADASNICKADIIGSFRRAGGQSRRKTRRMQPN
ncbi:hypothetical protein BD779DRAFT_1478298 [Infundibulicybe gibba]|nr:hypothetical protein BD779DRAFT_1478298 [Infundibulicybe gibba]